MHVRGTEGLILQEKASVPNPPAGHVALYSVDGSALMLRDEAGVVTTLGAGGGGGGTKISDLSAATAFNGTEEFALVQGGATVAGTVAQMDAYIGPVRSSSTAAQALGTAETYVTGSRIVLPQARMLAGVVYRSRISLTKTGAGTATPVFQVKTGTAGTTADTSRLSYTSVAQTAVADVGWLEFQCTFRAIGASTVLVSHVNFGHDLATTGFANISRSFMGQAVSASFDSTAANFGIGVTITPGAAAAWTAQQCYSELVNLDVA